MTFPFCSLSARVHGYRHAEGWGYPGWHVRAIVSQGCSPGLERGASPEFCSSPNAVLSHPVTALAFLGMCTEERLAVANPVSACLPRGCGVCVLCSPAGRPVWMLAGCQQLAWVCFSLFSLKQGNNWWGEGQVLFRNYSLPQGASALQLFLTFLSVCVFPAQTREWRPSAPWRTCTPSRTWKGPRSCLCASILAAAKISWTQLGMWPLWRASFPCPRPQQLTEAQPRAARKPFPLSSPSPEGPGEGTERAWLCFLPCWAGWSLCSTGESCLQGV